MALQCCRYIAYYMHVCAGVWEGGVVVKNVLCPSLTQGRTQGVSARGPVCLGHSTSEQHLTLQRRRQQSRSFIRHNIAPKLMEKLTRVVLLMYSWYKIFQCFNSLNL